MKNKKSIFVAILIALSIMLTCLSGCIISTGNGPSIESIEKTSSVGLVDTYTITYTDGSTYNFEITNGKDGIDGEDGIDGIDITVNELYDEYLKTHPNTSYEAFLKDVLEINVSSNTISINKALQSSAKVYTEFTENYRVSPMHTTKETALYLGSAVVYKVDTNYTYFITNYHVIYDANSVDQSKFAKRIVCYLYGSEGGPTSMGSKDENGCTQYDYGSYGIECEYVGGSVTADIAIVKALTSSVKAVNENVQPITFASGYHVGDTAIAIGNPEGEGISVTQGVVSIDNEYINLSVDGTTRSYRSIRIDTSIYSGSSGGGLFDVDGKLIGITNAGDGEDQNVNYAIPLEIVKSAVENIMYYGGNAKKITLGIEVLSSNSKYVFDAEKGYGKIVETVTISKVNEGSISSTMGLNVNDVIVSFVVNDVEYNINRNFNIGDILLTIRAGNVISFKVKRGGEVVQTTAYTVLDTDLSVVA
ncbi:MAG: serine protease [Clostridia bacterium]|nr:serine protease [Clostridia bacterium]